MRKLKEKYVSFLEEEKDGAIGKIVYFCLFLLSLIYGNVVTLRNFFYDNNIFPAHKCGIKVISIGNLSWGGSGKTTLSCLLYQNLTPQFKTAVLRRGYGLDEKKLLEEKNIPVFSSKNRVKLANELSDKFSLLILDDGFQYRKLYRDINIVVMAARELRKKLRLIPAGFFREPLASLKRADILVINHKNELEDIDETTTELKFRFKHLSIYTAEYKFSGILDIKNKQVNPAAVRNKKLAALTGIGYPGGFFNKLKEFDIKTCKEITYPDHYDLTIDDFNSLQGSLIEENIQDVIITEKDRYHLPDINSKINFYVLGIEMEIDNKQEFLDDLKNRLK
ncbi:MAG: tetraacyldisaccharide 4'-kinase [Candidatus Omnitrophica bacterium]|nr:tetraacyldisaccharide 4'-kinase [Candidatus Omnitrophota bacterium]